MPANPQKIEPSEWDVLKEEFLLYADKSRKELRETELMLSQSQLEVSKLTQRNAAITARLQQVQANLDTVPRSDIRAIYESTLDAQQRLFVMRGQLEKLQNDQNHLKKQVALAERVIAAIDSDKPKLSSGNSSSTTAETVEMIIQAQEAERHRLSRLMHDGPAQALSNFILQTEIAMRLFDIDQVKAKAELANMKVSAMGTFQKVRDFIFELRPMMLDDLGLAPTLKRYVDAYKEQTGLDIRLTINGVERRLESYQEVMVFRAIQELLHNAVRHSQASVIKVQVDMGDSILRVTVDDNGKGFDVDTLAEKTGMGLKVIRERSEMLGGIFEMNSVIEQGTSVSFQIPSVGVSVNV
jgi:two-component system sensor histidine kinase DegS